MAMEITFFSLLKNSAGYSNYLVNFQWKNWRLAGQFSVRVNTI
jgi:hypothetical protein